MIRANRMKPPKRFWIGIILVISFWYINWSFDELRTQWAFGPLWLGFAITIDSIVYMRKGSSLFSRNKLAYVGLFVLSTPVWWLFELFNQLTQNWHYMGREHFTDLEYFLLASLSFSTVIPVVFGNAELVSTFLKGNYNGPAIKETSKTGYVFILTGIIMLILLISFPKIFYVFIWTTVFFIIEGINVLIGNKSIISFISSGNWKPVFSLAVGCLICGFFWEMWNYFSYPKWVYNVPGVNFLHVFEMPLLGYLGYIPFSLELFSIYNFVLHVVKKKKLQSYVEIV